MGLFVQDYDAFDVANEDDELEEFLGIPRKHPKVGFYTFVFFQILHTCKYIFHFYLKIDLI